MSDSFYLIRESTLSELADNIRESYGLSNEVEQKEKYTLEELKEIQNKAKVLREEYLKLFGSNEKTLYVPREITSLSSISDKFSTGITSIYWEEGREELELADQALQKLSLKEIEIPEMARLGSQVFKSNTKLEKVVWKSLVMDNIPFAAFPSLNALSSFEITKEAAEKIKVINQNAFFGSSTKTAFLKLKFEDFTNLEKIGGYAFQRANLYPIEENGNLAVLTFPHSLQSIGDFAFQQAREEKLIIPNQEIQYGIYCFSNNYSLKEVEFEEGITDFVVVTDMFSGCSKLETLTNIECIKEIGSYGFVSCRLSEVDSFPNVIKLGNFAFERTNFTELSLPKLIYICSSGGGIFYGSSCTTLEFSPLLGSGLESDNTSYTNDINVHLFKDSKIDTIKFDGTLEEWCARHISSVDTDFPFYKTKTDDDGNTVFDQLYIKDNDGNYITPRGTLGSSISSDEPYLVDVEMINPYVFYGYKNFGSIKFSNNLKTLKANAFKDCSCVKGNDRIIFDMFLHEYISLNIENEYSTPFNGMAGVSTNRQAFLLKNLANSANPSYVSTITDTRLKTYELDKAIFPEEIYFNDYTFANYPSVTLNLGATTGYPNKNLKVTFGKRSFYQPNASDNGVTTFNINYTAEVTVKEEAFYNNTKFTGIRSTEDCNIISIEARGFYGCSSLKGSGASSSTELILPIVQTIGEEAFANCIALTTVTLGSINNPVTSIGENAFDSCSGITDLTIYFDEELYSDPSEMDNYPWGLTTATIQGISSTEIIEEDEGSDGSEDDAGSDENGGDTE